MGKITLNFYGSSGGSSYRVSSGTATASYNIPDGYYAMYNGRRLTGSGTVSKSVSYSCSSSRYKVRDEEWGWSPTRTYTDNCGNGPIASGDRLISKTVLSDGRCQWRYQEQVKIRDAEYETRYYCSYSGSETLTTYPINESPTITGGETDLGSKSSDFYIEYMVSDPDNDSVKVSIYVNDELKYGPVDTTVNVKKRFNVNVSELALGNHKVRIEAKDSSGASDTRTYQFDKSNSAPIISGKDENLGGKNSGFTLIYQVYDPNGDQLKVIEKLNGSIIRNLRNPNQNVDISFNVTDEQIKSFEVGKENTIEISADDGKGGLVYRRWTFVKNNLAPVISGNDRDLGEIEVLDIPYSVSDLEGDEVKVNLYLDGKAYGEQFTAVDNKEYRATIKDFDFIKLKPGKHVLKIVATDTNLLKSERVITFTRVVKRLVMKLKTAIETDVAAKKVLITPGWKVATGAIAKVEVCNNGFDTNPTWEDATSVVEAKKSFNFQNTSKTASKWGIDVRLTIERGSATTNSYITGIAGAFE